MNVIRFVFLTFLLGFGLVVDANSQQGDLGGVGEITDKGGCKGIFSFRITRFLASKTSTRLFVAGWFVSNNTSTRDGSSSRLKIYEKDGAEYKEVFNLEEKDTLDFREFGSLRSLALPGIVVNFSSDFDGDGPVWVVALVQEKFQVVYQGESSEIVDLDGDGISEIFESIWPDGDGYPKSTIIHVWNGTKYQRLITSKWESRFSKLVLGRITKYNKTRKPDRHRKDTDNSPSRNGILRPASITSLRATTHRSKEDSQVPTSSPVDQMSCFTLRTMPRRILPSMPI